MKQEDSYVAVVMEDVNSKFDYLLEVISTLATKEDLRQLDERVGRLEGDMEIVKLVVKETSRDVAVLKTDVAVLKADVAELKFDVAVLKEDVTILKTDVAVLKEDVSALKTDVEELKSDVGELKIDMEIVKGAVTTHDEQLKGHERQFSKLRSAFGK